MKTAKRIAIAAVAVVVAGGGCFGGYTRYQKKKDSKRVVDVVPVNLLVTDYWADESTTDATVASSGSQNVYLDSEKLVKKLYVKVGDKVKKGDVLLKYDMTVVELSVQQKKSQIALVRQQIKEEEKKLAKLKTLRPSEEAPAEPTYPDDPDVPDDPDTPTDPDTPDAPDTPDTPDVPVKLIDKVSSLAQAEEEDENGALVFYCSEKAAVDRNIMGALIISHKTALLNVCDESGTLLYTWYLDGANTPKELIEDWNVADGVEKTDESVSFNSLKFKAHGIFQVPADNKVPDDGDDGDDGDDSGIDDTDPDDSDDTDIDDTDPGDDYTPDDNSGDDGDSGDENYMYSRKELANMISEKETEIKSLKLDLKSAKLEYKNSLKQKKDGKVVAEQDGIVTRAGDDDDADSGSDASDDNGDGMDDGSGAFDAIDSSYSDGDYSDEDYSDEKTSDNGDKPYITVRGSKKTRININVGEMNLDKFQEGAVVQGMSYDTSESFSAKVLSIDPEPVSYSSNNYSGNPNSSTYSVLAEVQEDDVTFSADNYLSVTIPQTDTDSGGMYLPLQYVRKDGANYYVMKADKKGKLKKQYVATGKVIWGSYIEIKKGISDSDMICFPYGKNVKEGVKTRETDSVEE